MAHWSLYFEAIFYAIVLSFALIRAGWARAGVVLWGFVCLVMYERPYDFAHYSAPDPYSLVFPFFGMFFAAGVLAGWRFTPRPRAIIPYALGSLVLFFGKPLDHAATLGLYNQLPWLLQWHVELVFVGFAAGAFCAIRAARARFSFAGSREG